MAPQGLRNPKAKGRRTPSLPEAASLGSIDEHDLLLPTVESHGSAFGIASPTRLSLGQQPYAGPSGHQHDREAQEHAEGDRDPHTSHGSGKSGTGRTMVNICISFVGSGILGLPYAFSKGGMVQGIAIMAAVGVVAYHNMMKLVACKRKAANRDVHTYSELAAHYLGPWARAVVEAAIVSSQAGFSIAYMLFIGKNMSGITGLPGWLLIAACAPVEMALALVRSLTSLAPFSLIANAANLIGALVVLAEDVQHFPQAPGIHAWDTRGFTFLFGVSVYCFEGMAMVLPLEDAAKDKRAFPRDLAIGLAGITALYVSFAGAGYWAFGAETKDIITLNISGRAGALVQTCLSAGLLLTMPIMMVPCYEIFERSMLQAPLSKGAEGHVRLTVFRLTRVLAVAGVVTGPHVLRVPPCTPQRRCSSPLSGH